MAKTVIITGASSGIGEALAYRAAALGYNLCLAARNIERLEEVKTECLKHNVKCITVKTDVSLEADCIALINKASQEFNSIDILINNAGISMRALLRDCNTDVIRKVMDINFWGMVYCSKYALPHLLKSGGSIVGISSIAGIKGLPARTGYSASKFAMHGFLESLRIENLKTGLHVLIACPGYTASNIRNSALNSSGNTQDESPLDEKNLMQASEVAVHVFNAIDKRRNYIFLTLQGKLTRFLSRFFPAILDKLVYKKVAAEKDSPFS